MTVRRRYCEMCDEWHAFSKVECPKCGAPTRLEERPTVDAVALLLLTNAHEQLRVQLSDALTELTDTRRFWQAAKAEREELQELRQRICALADEDDLSEALRLVEHDHKAWQAACEAIKASEQWPPLSYPSMVDRWLYAALVKRAEQAEADLLVCRQEKDTLEVAYGRELIAHRGTEAKLADAFAELRDVRGFWQAAKNDREESEALLSASRLQIGALNDSLTGCAKRVQELAAKLSASRQQIAQIVVPYLQHLDRCRVLNCACQNMSGRRVCGICECTCGLTDHLSGLTTEN